LLSNIANRLSDEIREEELLWRLVTSNVFSWYEMETCVTLDDVLRANAVLDMQEYYRKEMAKRDNDK